jgi:hypothetical protein
MRFHGVLIVQHCGDAALGAAGGGFFQVALANQEYPAVVGQLKRGGLSGQTAANNEYVVLYLHVIFLREKGFSLTRSPPRLAPRVKYVTKCVSVPIFLYFSASRMCMYHGTWVFCATGAAFGK